MINLKTSAGRFFSRKDEANLFSWLEGIEGVESVYGANSSLIIMMADDISQQSTREIIAVLTRYHLDMKGFQEISKKDKFRWINNKNMFWFNSVWPE